MANYFLPFLVIAIIVLSAIFARTTDRSDDNFRPPKRNTEDFISIDPDVNSRPRKLNKIVRVALPGGWIGAIIINPRKALEQTIQKHNAAGWNCHQIIYHATHNLVIMFLQALLLVVTLGMWTFGAGYLLLFEKDNTDQSFSSRE
jgi:hypothetical protein